MPFHVSIQSAPEWRGLVGDPSSWGSSSDPSVRGPYTGKIIENYLLTVSVAGTIGSTATIEVTWSGLNGGSTGRLDLGTDVSYAADDQILLDEGILIAFSAGSLTGGHSALITATPAKRLPASFHRVDGDAVPDDVVLRSGSRDSQDRLFATDSGDIRAQAIRRGHSPRLTVSTQRNEQKKALEHMEGLRQEVMVGENYGPHTEMLLRGGGLQPLIGQMWTQSRATGGTYWDATSGLFRRQPSAATARTFPGVEFESLDESNLQDRLHVPSQYDHIGRSLGVCSVTTDNLMLNSHPKLGTGALSDYGWESFSGSPTLDFIKGAVGVLDPSDSNWPAGFTAGILRVTFNATNNEIMTEDITVSASTKYHCTIWTKGRGNLLYRVRSGSGSSGSQIGAFALSDYWKDGVVWTAAQVEVETGSGHNTLAFYIKNLDTTASCDLSAMSCVETDNRQPTAYEPSTTSAARRWVEVLSVNQRPPGHRGTLSFWFWNGGDDHSSNYSLVNCTDGTFDVQFDASVGSEQIEFHTDSSGSGNALSASFPSDTKFYTWNHVAVTWSWSVFDNGEIEREVYINGALITSDSSNDVEAWGETMSVFGGTGAQRATGWRIQELRMDATRLTAAEILDQYERFTEPSWTHIQRLYAGRMFRIGGISDRWVSPSNPHDLIADVALLESGVCEDSVVGEP